MNGSEKQLLFRRNATKGETSRCEEKQSILFETDLLDGCIRADACSRLTSLRREARPWFSERSSVDVQVEPRILYSTQGEQIMNDNHYDDIYHMVFCLPFHQVDAPTAHEG